MTKLSLREFNNRCNEEGFTVYIYSWQNQDDRIACDTIIHELVFKSVCVFVSQKKIFLRNEDDYISFKRVKHVFLDDSDCMLGKIFKIVCHSSATDSKEICHTVVAR